MKTLSNNWFTEGHIDFELKKYTLLAYLQQIQAHFKQQELYPPLSDLIGHYSNLLDFKEGKNSLQDQFPTQLSSLDVDQAKLVYERLIEDDELMKELEEIVQFSLEEMSPHLLNGKALYDQVEDELQLSPVGIVPLYTAEGYLLLRNGATPKAEAYSYQITLFEHSKEQYRGINTTYLGSFRISLSNTLETIKGTLISTWKTLPNPAVYLAECSHTYPLEETLLPIAKRSLVRTLSQPS